MFSKNSKALFVGAHPDDVEMNAGGTIHKIARMGGESRVVVLASRSQTRMWESRQALRQVGVTELYEGDGADTHLDRSLPQLIAVLEDVIAEFKPTVVVGHFHADTHQDHVAAYKVAVAAARKVGNFLMFKPTYPSGRPDIAFHPTCVSLLSREDMVLKRKAMEEFKSQWEKYGTEDWLDALDAVARGDAWTYGGVHGFAEVFQVGRVMV